MIAPGRKIVIVEYLRGLAALAVTWFHLTNTYAPGPVQISGSLGWLGVEAFFVISGFIIPYSIRNAYPNYGIANYPTFVGRRALRLEPPYVASIFLVLILSYISSLAPGFAGQRVEPHWGQIAAHFLYLVPLFDFEWMQPVYWTLAFEFVFYLFIGLAFPLLCADRSRRWVWLAAVAVLTALVLAHWLPFRLMLFVMGISVYRRLAGLDGVVWMFAGIATAAVAIGLQDQIHVAVVGAASALVIWACQNLTLPRIIDRVLIGLAAISYSLYLVHVPVGRRAINLGKRFIQGEWQALGLSLAGLAIAVIFAVIFWRVVERPAINLARRIGPSKSRPIATNVPADALGRP